MIKETELRLTEVISRTPSVKSFRLAYDGPMEFSAGQWMMVSIGDGAGMRKPLSISSSPTEFGYLEFTKRITSSDFSRKLDSAQAGDRFQVRFPFGNFIYEDHFPKIAFLSGGIGITPIRSICKNSIDKKLPADIVLLYSNRSAADIPFRDDLDVMTPVKVVHVLGEAGDEWSGWTGRIRAEIIHREIPDYLDRRFYLCGPPAMVEALTDMLLKEIGIPGVNIVTEGFAGY